MHQYGRVSGANSVCVSEHDMGSMPAECTHVTLSQGWVLLHIRVTVGELWGWGMSSMRVSPAQGPMAVLEHVLSWHEGTHGQQGQDKL